MEAKNLSLYNNNDHSSYPLSITSSINHSSTGTASTGNTNKSSIDLSSGSSSSIQFTKLADLKPNTVTALVGLIVGATPVKATKSNQFMTVVLLLDFSRSDYQNAFSLNLFRKSRHEIPIDEMKEGRILYINPVRIQTYQNATQGLCAARDTPHMCILTLPDFSDVPIRLPTLAWHAPPPFDTLSIKYFQSLFGFYRNKFIYSISGQINPPEKIEFPKKEILSFPNNTIYTSIKEMEPYKNYNIICQVVNVSRFHKNGTILTVTDFNAHSFPPSFCLSNPGFYFFDDCVLDHTFLIDVQCWDEHHIIAKTLNPGQLILLTNAFFKKSKSKLRLVLHGNLHSNMESQFQLEILNELNDPRCLPLKEKRASFISVEDLSPTTSSICLPFSTYLNVLTASQPFFRVRAQFLHIPPPSIWFYTFCLSCRQKLKDPSQHSVFCLSSQLEVNCEFQCVLNLIDGELKVVCREQGILDFLGGCESPQRYLDNPELMKNLENRVRCLSSPLRPKFCDVTIAPIPDRQLNGPSYCIVYTCLL